MLGWSNCGWSPLTELSRQIWAFTLSVRNTNWNKNTNDVLCGTIVPFQNHNNEHDMIIIILPNYFLHCQEQQVKQHEPPFIWLCISRVGNGNDEKVVNDNKALLLTVYWIVLTFVLLHNRSYATTGNIIHYDRLLYD